MKNRYIANFLFLFSAIKKTVEYKDDIKTIFVCIECFGGFHAHHGGLQS